MSADDIIARFMTQGLSSFENSFRRASSVIEQTEGKISGFQSVLGTLGVGVGVAGLNIISNRLIESGNEAANASRKLDGMLRVRGESGARAELDALAASLSNATGIDDDLFTDVQAHLLSFGLSAKQIAQIMPGLTGQANTMGQSLDGVADAFGRAFASGNALSLTRSGVVLSKTDKDAIDAAKSISEAAGQQELFNRVLASYGNFAVSAGEGITDAARAQGVFNTQIGNMMETLGDGASQARAKWQGALTPLVESMNQEHAGWLKNIGAMTEYATVAGNVAGPIYGLVKAFGELKNFQNLAKIAQLGETAAEKAKIGVAGQHGGAMGALSQKLSGTSAATQVLAGETEEAAGKLGILARAKAFLGAPIGGLTTMSGAPMTAGGVALGAALGVGAGLGVSSDMKSLGYSNGASDASGLAVGLGTAALVAFNPPAALLIGAAEALRQGIDHFYTQRYDREGDSVISNKEAQDVSKMSHAEKEDFYFKKRNEALAKGDEGSQAEAGSFLIQGNQERKFAKREDEANKMAAWSAQRQTELAAQRKATERAARDKALWEDPKPEVGQVQYQRNGARQIVMVLPESRGDRQVRHDEYASRTAAPIVY